jgi:predicted metallo-beta-lactamase superfamily hydrolase
MIIREKPSLAIIGGPPLYLAGFRVAEEEVQLGLKNLEKVVEAIPITILEHHILRDYGWREKASAIFEKAQKVGHRVLTAAEYLGEENAFLEAIRIRLYAENPPSKEFEKWMRVGLKDRKRVKPPL